MSGDLICPLCLEGGVQLLADKKGRPYFTHGCARVFVHSPAALRTLGLFSRTLRTMLREIGPERAAAGEKAALDEFRRARESGVAAWGG